MLRQARDRLICERFPELGVKQYFDDLVREWRRIIGNAHEALRVGEALSPDRRGHNREPELHALDNLALYPAAITQRRHANVRYPIQSFENVVADKSRNL